MKKIISKRSSKKTLKVSLLFISLALLVTCAAGATLAYLLTKTENVTNTFTPAQVSCRVEEKFDGTKKTNVNVTNTSDIKAYIRVKLVSYRVNDAGEHIGGTANINIDENNLGDNWYKVGEYYYYGFPVDSNGKPAADLIDSITLNSSYDDADGGRQVIEVMAEAIQAEPESAAHNAWGVDIQNGNVEACIHSTSDSQTVEGE